MRWLAAKSLFYVGYVSRNLAQLAVLGVSWTNLPQRGPERSDPTLQKVVNAAGVGIWATLNHIPSFPSKVVEGSEYVLIRDDTPHATIGLQDTDFT